MRVVFLEVIQHGIQVKILSTRLSSQRTGRETFMTKQLILLRRKSRLEGIDAVLNYKGNVLNGLLVPLQADEGVACSVAA
jgi:hypothetical protein